MRTEFIDEPELEFGSGRHVDIRFGLMNYGPLDSESAVAPKRICLGIVGTSETVEGLSGWIEKCRNGISQRQSNQPNLFVRFPGFREDNALNTTFVTDAQLQKTISTGAFDRLKPFAGSPLGVQEAVRLFMPEIEALSEKRSVDVILCALPMSLIKQQGVASGVAEGDGAVDEPRSLDFHHLLKATAMRLRVPIQLVLPMTWDESKRLPQRLKSFKIRSSQDEATRAWNLHVAMYYKAGGVPWRLPRTATALTSCHVGISFYESLNKASLLTSVAQVFNERGEGTIVRGGQAQIGKEDRQPHLSRNDAHAILVTALKAYRSEHHNFPARVVIHKSSRFSSHESEGFQSAVAELGIELIELLKLGDSTSRLFRAGAYPPLRGTLFSITDTQHVLYTRGSVDFFQTYPGMYAPQTLAIELHRAEHGARFLADEILGLSKMNWNKTQFDGFEPITLHAARQVGKILKYIPEDDPVQPAYAFYM